MEIPVQNNHQPLTSVIGVPQYQGAITKVFKSTTGLEIIYKQYQEDLKQWPVAYDEIMLHSDFGQTYCLRCGDINNPPLIMLHGLAVSSLSFLPNIAQLSKHFCVYLLDFPGGAGRSVPSTLMLKKRNVAAWLTDSIAQLEHRNVTVLGVSFGSWLATEYALTQPKQLDKLILASPPPQAGKTKLKVRTLFKMICLGVNKTRGNIEKLCQLLSAPNTPIDERVLTEMFNGLTHTKSFKESGHNLKKEKAHTIKVPIDFIIGEYEILCDEKSLNGHFPHASINIVENAGHMVNIEQSQTFNQLVVAAMTA